MGAASQSRRRAGLWLRTLVVVALAFSSLYLVTGDDGAPGGHLFALLLVFIASTAAGDLASWLGLPALLGMLVAGILLRNLPYVGDRVGSQVDPAWSSAIRLLALTLILVRAGLAFDVHALRRLLGVVARLAVLPNLAEASVAAALAMALLDFPPLWAATLGFVVSPISPAVVVPSLLALQDQGYGASTGIPTLIVAAAPLDDVLAIAGFGICLSLATSQAGANPWVDVARAPLEVLLGVGVGALSIAVLALLAPVAGAPGEKRDGGAPASGEQQEGDQEEEEEEEDAVSLQSRLALLCCLAVTAAFGFRYFQFSGASALSVLVLGIGASQVWGPAVTESLSSQLAGVWNSIAQPLLFGLVGAAVSVASLGARAVGAGLLILACSLLVRCSIAYLVVCGLGLRPQERVFTALAWMPKATVQAAIGGLALDQASNNVELVMAGDILTVAVLAILVTAPLGAIAIAKLGPRLLTREAVEPSEDSRDCQTGASQLELMTATVPP